MGWLLDKLNEAKNEVEKGWKSFEENELKTAQNEVEKGWKSFEENELKTAQNVIAVAPTVIEARNEQVKQEIKENITDPAGEIIGDTWKEVKKNNPLVALTPAITAVDVIDKTLVQGKDLDKAWDETTNEQTILNIPKTVINEAPKFLDEAGKTIENGWNDVTNTVTTTYNNTVEKTREVVSNVSKGVTDALPIIAIGGAAILGLSLLLGRR